MDRVVREMRNAYLYETTKNWRAVCIERCKHWFGGGRMEKDQKWYLASRLPYNIHAVGLTVFEACGEAVRPGRVKTRTGKLR